MPVRAYSINEREDQQGAEIFPFNLVSLRPTPDVDKSYHTKSTSSKPLSRNQRCFRYLDCFNGGLRLVLVDPAAKQGGATSKAVYLSSQFDRKTDCFDEGRAISFFNEGARHSSDNCVLVKQKTAESCQVATLLRTVDSTLFKAVCLTQTRMPEGFNLMCNQNQALTTPVNLVGGAVMRTIPVCRMEHLTTL